MGYIVSNYSIQAIQEIINSRDVMPSLFWAIPSGKWETYELEELFINVNSVFRNKDIATLGTFFIRNAVGENPANRKPRRLQSLDKGTSLHQLLSNINSFESKSLLILSSNFPKPGWAIKIKVDTYEAFEKDLQRVLGHPVFNEIKELSNLLEPYVYKMKGLKEVEPPRPQKSSRYASIAFERSDERQRWEADFNKLYMEYTPLLLKYFEKSQEISPYVLMECEKAFSNRYKLVCWDEINMIGWKTITNLDNKKTVEDFIGHLNETFELPIEDELVDRESMLHPDFFNDYIHYLLLNKTFKYSNKREVTKKVLQYFGIDDRRSILRNLQLQETNIRDLNEFLSLLGWPEDEYFRFDTSLISFFSKDLQGYQLTNPGKETWSRLRECLESCVKDMIKILAADVSSSKKEIVSIIEQQKIKYNFNYPNNWDKEIDKLTSGAAAILIKILGPIKDPTQDWDLLSTHIEAITNILNANAAHHQAAIKREDLVAKELTPHFNGFFKQVKQIFVSLPYHFTPSSISWSHPTIYTGIAWSHDQSEKKEINVLHYENNLSLNKEVLIWNPSKINPVMVNYKLI